MAKLKCTAHGQRVMVLPDSQGTLTLHRSDGSRCVVNPTLTINDQLWTPIEIAMFATKDLWVNHSNC